MCYDCGKIISVSYNMTLQELLIKAGTFGDYVAKEYYKAIFDKLQSSGGCSSCIRMIIEKIR